MAVRDTSLDAYIRKYLPTASDKQARVLRYLYDVGDATNKEISEATGININATTPTVFALRDKGLVFEGAVRRCRHTGNDVHSWSIVESPRPQKREKKMAYFAVINNRPSLFPEHALFENFQAAENYANKNSGRIVRMKES